MPTKQLHRTSLHVRGLKVTEVHTEDILAANVHAVSFV